MSTFYDFTIKDQKNSDFPLSSLKGKVVLVVNVASKCGFTPQYKGLEELYKKYSSDDFLVVGFPCNQFGAQEPGSNDDIQSFCKLTYDVSFPVMAKVDVNGNEASPVYRFLKEKAPGLLGTEMIKWNFTKFLVDKTGNVVARYAPNTEPKDIEKDIAKLLSS